MVERMSVVDHMAPFHGGKPASARASVSDCKLMWLESTKRTRMSANRLKAVVVLAQPLSARLAKSGSSRLSQCPAKPIEFRYFAMPSVGGQTARRRRIYPGDSVSYAADIGDEEPGSNGLGTVCG